MSIAESWSSIIEKSNFLSAPPKLKLKASLAKCGGTSVENDVEYIHQNVPEIFVDDENDTNQ